MTGDLHLGKPVLALGEELGLPDNPAPPRGRSPHPLGVCPEDCVPLWRKWRKRRKGPLEPGTDVSLPESEEEEDRFPPPASAPSPGASRGAILKNGRQESSPYPQRERKRPAHLEYKYLDGGAQTRGPPAAPDAGGSDPLPEQQPLPPEEEDSDLEKTIPNSEDGDDEYLASEDDSEINQISVLMDV